MKNRSLTFALLLAFTTLAGGAVAADGAVIGSDKLNEKDRSSLAAQITASKGEKKATFELVARLKKDMVELDATKRGRAVPVSAILKKMGKDALLPMLNEIAFEGGSRADMNDGAWTAWRLGLVEAVGFLRDTRSAPVLAAILDGSDESFDLIRMTASAFGKLGTDAAAQKLVAMSKQKGAKAKAVLAGMGDCRRLVIAEALASAMANVKDEETTILLARALGDVGSAWAWKTPIIAASGEEKPVRAAAAQALVSAYLHHEGQAREAITKAILLVDDPSTAALVEGLKRNANDADKKALEALAERVAKNPIHI